MKTRHLKRVLPSEDPFSKVQYLTKGRQTTETSMTMN